MLGNQYWINAYLHKYFTYFDINIVDYKNIKLPNLIWFCVYEGITNALHFKTRVQYFVAILLNARDFIIPNKKIFIYTFISIFEQYGYVSKFHLSIYFNK